MGLSHLPKKLDEVRSRVQWCEGPGGVGQLAVNQLLSGDNDILQQGAPIMMVEVRTCI